MLPWKLEGQNLGGCSLERHWKHAEKAEANPNDKEGKPYKGKSLRMLLSEGKLGCGDLATGFYFLC